MAGSYEPDNEPFGSIRSVEFIDSLMSNFQLLKDLTPCSWLKYFKQEKGNISGCLGYNENSSSNNIRHERTNINICGKSLIRKSVPVAPSNSIFFNYVFKY